MTEKKKKTSESRLFVDSFDRSMNEEDLMYKGIDCCNMIYDSSAIDLNPNYITTACSTDNRTSSIKAIKFEKLKESVNTSAVSADEIKAGLIRVANVGKVFKTHLKRSDLNLCF